MNQTRALPWVIAILDDGLRIYRRFLRSFVVAASIIQIPATIVTLLFSAFVQTELGTGSAWSLLAVLLVLLVTYPTYLYSMSVMSRMTDQIMRRGEPQFRVALRMRPGRLVGMGCYNIMFSLVMGLVFGMVGGICGCVALIMLGFGSGGLSLISRGSFGPALGLLVFAGVALLLVLLAVGGGLVAGAVYATQPFSLERQGFGATVSRATDLLFYRFGRNLLCLVGAGGLSATLSLAYSGTLSTVSTWVFQRLGVQSLVIANAASTLVTALISVVLLPPLPIWMALLFDRLRTERDGGDLTQRIATWAQTNG